MFKFLHLVQHEKGPVSIRVDLVLLFGPLNGNKPGSYVVVDKGYDTMYQVTMEYEELCKLMDSDVYCDIKIGEFNATS